MLLFSAAQIAFCEASYASAPRSPAIVYVLSTTPVVALARRRSGLDPKQDTQRCPAESYVMPTPMPDEQFWVKVISFTNEPLAALTVVAASALYPSVSAATIVVTMACSVQCARAG